MVICESSYQYSIQYSRRNSYVLDLGFTTIDLTFCQLLAFRKKILDYSSYTSIENIIDSENYILLFVADRKHLLILDVPQILELKRLLLTIFKEHTVLS